MWVIIPLWLSGSSRSFLCSSVYSCHLVWIFSVSVRSILFLSFIVSILWIILQWTQKCRYLLEILVSIFLDMYSEINIISYTWSYDSSLFTVLKNLNTFSLSTYTNLHFHQWFIWVSFLHNLANAYLLFSFFVFNSHSNWCVGIFPGFYLCFPDD